MDVQCANAILLGNKSLNDHMDSRCEISRDNTKRTKEVTTIENYVMTASRPNRVRVPKVPTSARDLQGSGTRITCLSESSSSAPPS